MTDVQFPGEFFEVYMDRDVPDAQLSAAGVSPDLVRLSVGIEDVEDILADVEKALAGV